MEGTKKIFLIGGPIADNDNEDRQHKDEISDEHSGYELEPRSQ